MRGDYADGENAAVLHNTTTRQIYGLVEKGKVHFIETDAKVLYVCSGLIDPAISPD